MEITKHIIQYRKELEFKNYAENSIGNHVSQVTSFLNYFASTIINKTTPYQNLF